MNKDISIELINNVLDIPSREWEQLGIEKLFGQQAFLHTTATTNPHMEHTWVSVKEEGVLIGVLYFQIIPFNGAELKSYKPGENNGFFSNTKLAVVDCVLDKIDWQLAVLGNIFITGENGQYFTKNIPNKKKWSIIEIAANHLFETLKPDAVLITDVYNDMLEGTGLLEKNKFRPFAVEPDMILKIEPEWEDFGSYLASISSKYRVRAKKVLKTSKALSKKEMTIEDCETCCDDLYNLYSNVMNGVDFKLASASREYFASLKKAYPNEFFVDSYSLDGQIIGFISYFVQNNQMDVHLLGLNYQFNKEHAVYQRILYDCIELGIGHSVQRIHFGRTASVIKSTIGAKPVPVQSFIKHVSTFTNIAFKPLTSYLKPEPFTIRNPFK